MEKVTKAVFVERGGTGLEIPCPYYQIDVKMDGVSTILKSYLAGAGPVKIGDKVRARFRTGDEATRTCLDLYWERICRRPASPTTPGLRSSAPPAGWPRSAGESVLLGRPMIVRPVAGGSTRHAERAGEQKPVLPQLGVQAPEAYVQRYRDVVKNERLARYCGP